MKSDNGCSPVTVAAFRERMQRYVSSEAREIATEILDDIADEQHDGGVYVLAQWVDTLTCAGVAQNSGWQPIETRPANGTYLVANEKGQVAPWVRGVIHNNVGTAWDWSYGEAIVRWMPLPTYSHSSTTRGACHDHPTKRCTPDDCCQPVTSKLRGEA